MDLHKRPTKITLGGPLGVMTPTSQNNTNVPLKVPSDYERIL